MPPVTINNPYVLVKSERRDETLRHHRGKAVSTLINDREGVFTKLNDTLGEMGDVFDLSLITSIKGGAGDKVEAIINMHSDLAAYDEAIREIRAIEAAQQKMKEGTLDQYLSDHNLEIDNGIPMSPFYPGAKKEDSATQLLKAAAKKGVRLGQAESQIQTYEFDMMQNPMYAAIFRTAAGWDPEDLRIPGLLVDSIQRPLQVTDIFNVIRTTQSSVKYMAETTFTNAAVEIAEATNADGTTAATGYYPESALAVTEQTENIRKIGTHIPVTQEQLEDVGFVRAYLNRRLPFMVRQVLDGRLLGGSGGIQVVGVMNRTNVVKSANTTATVTDFATSSSAPGDGAVVASGNFNKPLNQIAQAQSKVMFDAYGIASHCVMHPTIWTIIMTQESASGGYYLGSPAGMFQPRIWGMPVVQAQSGVSHTSSKTGALRFGAVVGDFTNWADLVVRKDMEIQIGVINIDFLKDMLRIKASVRVGLLVYRPQAFVVMQNPVHS